MGLLPEFKPKNGSTDSEPMAKPAKVAKAAEPENCTLASLAPLATRPLFVDEATPSEQRFDDDTLAAMMLAQFPGSQLLGVYPKDTFQGPMLDLPDVRRCPVCAGTKHWRLVEGQQVCALCNQLDEVKATTYDVGTDGVGAIEGDAYVVYPRQPDLFRGSQS